MSDEINTPFAVKTVILSTNRLHSGISDCMSVSARKMKYNSTYLFWPEAFSHLHKV